jgi:hypothetical protein
MYIYYAVYTEYTETLQYIYKAFFRASVRDDSDLSRLSQVWKL